MKGDLPGVGGEGRRRAKDGGVEKEREGWGVEKESEGWGVDKESEGWGSGEGERRLGEWRRKAKDGGVETTVKRAEEEGNINRRPVSVLDSPGLQG